ncbi:MAG: YlbF family regulator [Lachnospiraceae bacterium]|nr:YlbF family regulator [Lachnospiraceae bacterium]
MDIEIKARELADLLVNGDVYKRYIAARKEIAKEPELKAKVDEFRKKNFFMQNEDNQHKFDDLKKLKSDYYEIMADKRVKRYLDSELILCRTIQRINAILVENLDVDVSFIS